MGLKAEKSLSGRQLLRLATKEKKMQPKLSKEVRRQKYVEEKLENERDLQKAKHLVCLGCREQGHMLKYCPRENLQSKVICFNCGSNDHPLRSCTHERKGNGELPFASCFVCNGKGHISKDCPQNKHGLYPQGGCCHICLAKSHLVKDCPQREQEPEKKSSFDEIVLTTVGSYVGGDDLDNYNVVADEDDDDDISFEDTKKKQKKRRRM